MQYRYIFLFFFVSFYLFVYIYVGLLHVHKYKARRNSWEVWTQPVANQGSGLGAYILYKPSSPIFKNSKRITWKKKTNLMVGKNRKTIRITQWCWRERDPFLSLVLCLSAGKYGKVMKGKMWEIKNKSSPNENGIQADFFFTFKK